MIAEVTGGFYGHKTTILEFKMQLVEVEAWGAREFSECSTTEAWAEC
jgi:hypothetical protein